MTLRVGSLGQSYQIPLIGKYGHHPGTQTLDRIFEVNLIPFHSSTNKKIFRLRGVADAYESFDRPESGDARLPENIRSLEDALVSPFAIVGSERESISAQDERVLRCVKVVDPNKKAHLQESKRKQKQLCIQFTVFVSDFNKESKNRWLLAYG